VVRRRPVVLRQAFHIEVLREAKEFTLSLTRSTIGKPLHRDLRGAARQSPRACRSQDDGRGRMVRPSSLDTFSASHELDHSLVGSRARVPNERLRAQEHHNRRFLPACFGNPRAQSPLVEARHDVRNDPSAIAVDLTHALFAIGRVRDREHAHPRACGRRRRAQDGMQQPIRPKATAARAQRCDLQLRVMSSAHPKRRQAGDAAAGEPPGTGAKPSASDRTSQPLAFT